MFLNTRTDCHNKWQTINKLIIWKTRVEFTRPHTHYTYTAISTFVRHIEASIVVYVIMWCVYVIMWCVYASCDVCMWLCDVCMWTCEHVICVCDHIIACCQNSNDSCQKIHRLSSLNQLPWETNGEREVRWCCLYVWSRPDGHSILLMHLQVEFTSLCPWPMR